jgi:hypothetical protein
MKNKSLLPKVQLANTMSHTCSSKGKYFTRMLQELLKITVDSHVTFPLNCTITFVDILAIFAHESALFTLFKIKLTLFYT